MKIKKNILKYKNPTTGEYDPIPVVATDGVSKESIEAALGYTPADEGDVTELNEKLVQETGKISKEIDTLTVSGKAEEMTCFFDKILSSNIFDKTQPYTEHAQLTTSGDIKVHNSWSSLVTYFISIENLGTENYRAYNGLGGNFKIAEYNSDKSFNTNTTVRIVNNNTLFTLDENTEYVRFEIYKGYLDTMMFGVFPTKITDYVAYNKNFFLKEEYLKQKSVYEIPCSVGDLSPTKNLSLDFSDIRKNCVFSFFGKVSSFESIEFKLGENNGYSSWIVIDGTKIKNYYLNKNSLIEEFEHGLTIGNVLGFTVKISTDLDSNKHSLMADICLTSNTGVYRTRIKTYGGLGKIIAFTNDSAIDDCKISAWSDDFNNCDVWGYGDSYFDTWTIYSLAGDGKLNMLMDNYTGRGSIDALSSFKKALNCATPKKVLWCMGMNDADSTSEVNPNWLMAYNQLVTLCKNNDIELILCTIPNVPQRNHSFKNSIIRNSGYRYADVSKAVGSEMSTSWYDGLLGDDNVHPNGIKGATVIMNAIFTDVPEISM